MSKKKSISSTQSEPKADAGQQPLKPAPAEGRKAAGEKKAPDKQQAVSSAPSIRKRGLSEEEIGSVAGETWHLLSQQGGQSLTALKKSIDAPGDLVAAAVGWLAREGKLELQARGRSVKVSLRH